MTLAEKCTNPNAPFYNTDMIVLNYLDGRGVNASCETLMTASILVIGVSALMSLLAMLVIQLMIQKFKH